MRSEAGNFGSNSTARSEVDMAEMNWRDKGTERRGKELGTKKRVQRLLKRVFEERKKRMNGAPG